MRRIKKTKHFPFEISENFCARAKELLTSSATTILAHGKTKKKQIVKSVCLYLYTQFKHQFCKRFSINLIHTEYVQKAPILPVLRSSGCTLIYLSHLFHQHKPVQLIHLTRSASSQRVLKEQGSTQNTGLNSSPSSKSYHYFKRFISHNSDLIPSSHLLLHVRKSTRCSSCGNYLIFHQITL